jgi:hypothetical protein
MTEGVSYCSECKRPLLEIDNRGRRLTGCTTCNIWQDQDGNTIANWYATRHEGFHAGPLPPILFRRYGLRWGTGARSSGLGVYS